MASGTTLATPDLQSTKVSGPYGMVFEERFYGPGGAQGQRRFLRANASQDTQVVIDMIAPSGYSAATGITVNLAVSCELPNTQGTLVFGASVERLAPNVAGSVINQDSWGTEATNTLALSLAKAGAVKYVTVAVPKASFGGGTGASLAAGELMRVRIRRIKSNASDTCTVDALILGIEIRET